MRIEYRLSKIEGIMFFRQVYRNKGLLTLGFVLWVIACIWYGIFDFQYLEKAVLASPVCFSLSWICSLDQFVDFIQKTRPDDVFEIDPEEGVCRLGKGTVVMFFANGISKIVWNKKIVYFETADRIVWAIPRRALDGEDREQRFRELLQRSAERAAERQGERKEWEQYQGGVSGSFRVDYELDAEGLARLLYLMDVVQYECRDRAQRRRKGLLLLAFGVAIVFWLKIPGLLFMLVLQGFLLRRRIELPEKHLEQISQGGGLYKMIPGHRSIWENENGMVWQSDKVRREFDWRSLKSLALLEDWYLFCCEWGVNDLTIPRQALEEGVGEERLLAICREKGIVVQDFSEGLKADQERRKQGTRKERIVTAVVVILLLASLIMRQL